MVNVLFQSTLDFPTHEVAHSKTPIPTYLGSQQIPVPNSVPIFLLSKNFFRQEKTPNFLSTLWFPKGSLCKGCYRYTVNVSHPSQTPANRLCFGVLASGLSVGVCPLRAKGLVMLLRCLYGLVSSWQAGKIHPTFHFVHKVVHPKSTSHWHEKWDTGWVLGIFWRYLYTYGLGNPQPWVRPASCPFFTVQVHTKDIPCGRRKNRCTKI